MKNNNINMTREQLVEKLRNEMLEVTFDKVDGEERVMQCTLQENVVAQNWKPSENTKKKSDEVIAVWDVNAEGWRSFRFDNVKKVVTR